MPKWRGPGVLPGFGLTMGYTLVYLSLIVLIPLAAVFVKSVGGGWEAFWRAVSSPQAIASFKLTIGASLVGALINAVFGFIVAWTLVRYYFPGKKIFDAIVDIPFALPTAVSGIALATIFAPKGWLGKSLSEWHIPAFNSPLGITIALTFIGLPFVVRTMQPAIQDLSSEVEEAAASLGASRWQAFWKVIFPSLMPALLTGFALAFARALGEYGSVIFIAGNIPMKTQITTQLIVIKLNEHDDIGAAALAVVMLVFSFLMLFVINLLQRWSYARFERAGV